MTETRKEHIEWCKQRALDLLSPDHYQALSSIASDVKKHEETGHLQEMVMKFIYTHPTAEQTESFIKGFN